MTASDDRVLVRALRDVAQPLRGGPGDLNPLMELVGDARLVLVGEATHGTHEFYRLRAQLTKRLVVEKGFRMVAAEADWPDAWRVNRYVTGATRDGEAVESLAGFQRFPSWMWRNADMLDFAGWLRGFNDGVAPEDRAGFCGLDLYSLHASAGAVLRYLDEADPTAAERARRRYACFDAYDGNDPEEYARATSFGMSAGCEDQAVAQLVELQRARAERLAREAADGDEDEAFSAEQNARVVQDAEAYYRTMFQGRVSSWNLRDRHMADALDALLLHLGRTRRREKVVVWAHNSHVGDARATEMGEQGEWNVGQLARQRHPKDAILIGFSTYQGTVTAASAWGGAAERKQVREGRADGYEWLFHQVGLPSFALTLRDLGEVAGALRERRLQRAIGVVYHPRTERQSHYFHARLPSQFDAVIHVDRTRALEPLEVTATWERGEAPETFPSGL